MQPKTRGWIIVTLLAVGLGAALAVRALRADELVSEHKRLRDELATVRQLAVENQALAAKLPGDDQLAALRADHAAVDRLRKELSRLRSQAVKSNTAGALVSPAGLPSQIVPVTEWQYAGRATPAAAVETILWAAVGGDVDALAATLDLDPATRKRALALLDALPASSRSEYSTPERLVALFTARDLPSGAMQLVSEVAQPSGDVMMRVRLYQPDGSTRSTTVLARKTEGEWRLAVPASAIDRYAAVLQGTPATK